MLSRVFWCWCWFWLLFLVALARSQSPVQTFFPASIPLANRSPYLSAWHSSTNTSGPLSHSWPSFWDQNAILGWAGKIRVDGVTYSWMGDDMPPASGANVTNVQVTPTRSIFVMQAGPMNVTITFLSPIEPSDWVLQSVPFSYVSVEASSLDDQAHDVQVYSDISAEWLSGDRGSSVSWSQQTSSGSIYHEIQLMSPEQYVEEGDQQAQDGITYYAMANRQGLSWQIDTDVASRGQFSTHGSLTDTASTKFAPIQPIFTVYAIAVDLGQIQSTQEPVTWAVGYVRNPSIAFTAPDFTVHQLSPYFVTKYGTTTNMGLVASTMILIDDFTAGYGDALQRAIAFDEAVIADASAVSSHYVDLVSLAMRQTFGTMDITVSTGSDGKPNASDVRIFMKDIGDIGSTGRINPVERMYAALPALLFTGDGSLLNNHYNLTKRWANYLVGTTLTPSNQRSADNEGTANMTNLAIKGIVGVKAMAEISRAVGQDMDATQFDSHASALVGQWESLALSANRQHILGVYGNQVSWALMYNMYADRLLGTSLVNDTLLQSQTAFYKSLLSSVPTFGLQLDNTALGTSAAWLLFTAATVQDNGVRDSLIENVWSKASSNLTAGAFPDQWNVQTGAVLEGSAGPAVGGVFSLLALNLPVKDIVVLGPQTPNNPGVGSAAGHSSSNTGAILGGVVGGVAIVVLAVVGVFLFLRWRRRDRSAELEKADITYEPHRPTLSPYACSSEDVRPTSHDTSMLESGVMTAQGNASGAPELLGSSASLIPIPENSPLNSQSMKMRELALNARVAYADTVSGSSNAGSNTGSASSRDPLSPGESHKVLGLRAEVESLRRVMQEIRNERLEPPPEYTG
ncbi:DUF1793-domain-containing protein [Trametes gibbosa]|nr:DUF1793-domain-containing protein [Trametes gibbosa]